MKTSNPVIDTAKSCFKVLKLNYNFPAVWSSMDNNSVTVITVISVQSKIKTSFIVASNSNHLLDLYKTVWNNSLQTT